VNRSSRQAVRLAVGITAVVVAMGSSICCSTAAGHRASQPENEPSAQRLADEWGVEVLGIRRTSAGYMLDFRYRVLDAQKAAPILDRRIVPYIKVAGTGTRLLVPQAPKLGSMRQTSFAVKENRNYFIVFANPSQIVDAGDQVSVVVGEFNSGKITVE
jgi:hypothetical protein